MCLDSFFFYVISLDDLVKTQGLGWTTRNKKKKNEKRGHSGVQSGRLACEQGSVVDSCTE